MDSVGQVVTGTPVDLVAAKSLAAGKYALLNEAGPSVRCWLRDAPIADVNNLDVSDSFTIPECPQDGWRALVEVTSGSAIYLQSKQSNANGRIVVADG